MVEQRNAIEHSIDTRLLPGLGKYVPLSAVLGGNHERFFVCKQLSKSGFLTARATAVLHKPEHGYRFLAATASAEGRPWRFAGASFCVYSP